jgi:hypothetical protein
LTASQMKVGMSIGKTAWRQYPADGQSSEIQARLASFERRKKSDTELHLSSACNCGVRDTAAPPAENDLGKQ